MVGCSPDNACLTLVFITGLEENSNVSCNAAVSSYEIDMFYRGCIPTDRYQGVVYEQNTLLYIE
jgi:hypothetical protein